MKRKRIQTKEHIQKRIESRRRNNENYMPPGFSIWNKGKNKENDLRIAVQTAKRIKGRKMFKDYVLIYLPNHPSSVRGYYQEHRYVMEQSLGRYLTKSEVIHHINQIKSDNRIENLRLMTNSEHVKLHAKGIKWTKEALIKREQTKLAKYGKSRKRNASEAAKKAWETKRSNSMTGRSYT